MEFNGRYYLWDPRHSITVGPILEQEPGMVKIEPGRLSAALDKLQAMAATVGRAKALEVHCHGLSGRLLLGTDDGVTARNVAWFGSILNKVTLPGALIELLACLVASQRWTSGNVLRAEPQNIKGYEPEYHGKIQELYMDKRWNTKQGLPLSGMGYKPKAIQPFKPDLQCVPNPEADGLSFCRTLARSACATVRAAYVIQGEEAKLLDSDLTPMVSPIGNWEGPVFDFFQDGSVKCIGMSPYRPTSFGPIRVDIGGPLAVC